MDCSIILDMHGTTFHSSPKKVVPFSSYSAPSKRRDPGIQWSGGLGLGVYATLKEPCVGPVVFKYRAPGPAPQSMLPTGFRTFG